MSDGEAPEISYAQTTSGVHIAYNTVGDGPQDVVYVSEWALPLEGRWVEPTTARLLRRLTSFSRVISFDKRGIGCSDPVPLQELTVLEEWMDDLRTVMDAVGLERAALLAPNESGPAAILFATTYPDRVTALVLVNAFPRWLASDDYPWGIPEAAHDQLLQGVSDDWASGGTYSLTVPTMAANQHLRSWSAGARRLQASPATARALYQSWAGIDVRPLLPLVQCPTLVLHRAENFVVRVGHGRYLAERIPGAKYVEVPGADVLWWVGDGDVIIDEIGEFLTGVRHSPDAERVLATVLFTDIAGSTEQAASLGDRAWRAVLDRHRAAVRELLPHFRGREVNTRGDDFLAIFDGPARAIRCALAVTEATRALGIEVRSGLHTGEVEPMGDDITGIAVHIGARISELAGPAEIVVSRTVVDLVTGSGIDFDDRGEHELKGIPGTWHLYAVKS